MSRLHALDALRGLAAIAVLVGHTGQHAQGWYTGMYGLSVDFFLMLSGYVLARSYEGRLGSEIGSLSFLGKRFRRLFPVAALGATFALAYALLTQPLDPTLAGSFAAALLFLPWPGAQGAWLFPLNGPRWSLFTELLANMLHGLLFARLGTKGLALLAVASFLAATIFALDLGIWPTPGRSETFVPGILRMLSSYMIGILLWRWQGERRVVTISMTMLCSLFAFSVFVGGLVPSALFGPFFVLAISPVLVIGGATCNLSGTAARFAAAAGALSYPLYALHDPLLHFGAWIGLGGAAMLVIGLTAVASIIAALALWPRNTGQDLPLPAQG